MDPATATDVELWGYLCRSWPVPMFRFCGLYEIPETLFCSFAVKAVNRHPTTDEQFMPVREALRKWMAYHSKATEEAGSST